MAAPRSCCTARPVSRTPSCTAGLVEVGVGLLPGGGGCKEMTIRAIDKATHIRPQGRGESVELMEAMKQAFETVAMAKVSTSASEARNSDSCPPATTSP